MAEAICLAIAADPDGIGAAIAQVLLDDGRCVAGDAPAAILIDGFDMAAPVAFLDISDADFFSGAIGATLDRVARLQQVLAERAGPIGIVVIGSDAHLGRWHGAAQAAASAALVGIVRSVAMEHARVEVRVNLLALPIGTTRDDTTLIADAATHAFALFGGGAINGATILLDDGANLKFRQARRR